MGAHTPADSTGECWRRSWAAYADCSKDRVNVALELIHSRNVTAQILTLEWIDVKENAARVLQCRRSCSYTPDAISPSFDHRRLRLCITASQRANATLGAYIYQFRCHSHSKDTHTTIQNGRCLPVMLCVDACVDLFQACVLTSRHDLG